MQVNHVNAAFLYMLVTGCLKKYNMGGSLCEMLVLVYVIHGQAQLSFPFIYCYFCLQGEHL